MNIKNKTIFILDKNLILEDSTEHNFCDLDNDYKTNNPVRCRLCVGCFHMRYQENRHGHRNIQRGNVPIKDVVMMEMRVEGHLQNSSKRADSLFFVNPVCLTDEDNETKV